MLIKTKKILTTEISNSFALWRFEKNKTHFDFLLDDFRAFCRVNLIHKYGDSKIKYGEFFPPPILKIIKELEAQYSKIDDIRRSSLFD